MSKPWLTIITVVKDDPSGFRATVGSICEQELDDVEFLVIDSSANKSEIREALEDLQSRVSIAVHWCPPEGIYSAMNTGLSLATGEFCYFANAGDVLFSSDTLARVRTSMSGTSTGDTASTWAFGPVEILSQDGTRVITPSWDYAADKRTCFSNGHFPCHQGTFASTSALRSFGGFDTSYSIVADYAAFLRLSQVSDPIELDFVIATFAEGGVSTTRWQESFRQFHAARVSILRPSGVAALRERWNTASQYAKVFVVRNVLRRGRA